MKSHRYLALLALLFWAGATSAQSAASKIAPSKGWLNDLNVAKTQAVKTGKPMMVVFRCDP
jgi:hypothetical protein